MDASGKGQIERIQPAYVSTYDGGIQFTRKIISRPNNAGDPIPPA